MSQVHLIAEAGTNHGGNFETAVRLAKIAKEAGADSVKYQIIYPEGLYLPKFFKDGAYEENEVFHLRQAAMLSDEEYSRLAGECTSLGIPFSASVFDQRGIDLLMQLDVPYIKIASCDLNNSSLLVRAAETGKKLIFSTGMSSLGEIEKAVSDVLNSGNRDLVLLHCVSIYPCPTERMNLSFIKTLQSAFGLPVGLSDHSRSSVAAAIAISMGVTWIEKHFTYDNTATGFDHAYALEPEDLKTYISDIRQAEAACQHLDDKLSEAELTVRSRARRSIYAARHLEAGTKISASDLLVVRPEGPLEPNDLAKLIGQELKQPVQPFEALRLDYF